MHISICRNFLDYTHESSLFEHYILAFNQIAYKYVKIKSAHMDTELGEWMRGGGGGGGEHDRLGVHKFTITKTEYKTNNSVVISLDIDSVAINFI